jgi:hypothetical protein
VLLKVDQSQASDEQCKLIVLRRIGAELLVRNQGSMAQLPCILIPRGQRFAASVCDALREHMAIEAYCLFALQTDIPYAVMEMTDLRATVPSEYRWVSVQQFERIGLSVLECEAIRAALHTIADGNTPGLAKPGWIQSLLNWVQQEVAPLGMKLTGEIQQFNASSTSALLRFATDGPAVWFKAASGAQRREMDITVLLGKVAPAFVPELIDIHPELPGWLTVECCGPTLAEDSSDRTWARVASVLGALQFESTRYTRELLNAGCRDLSISRLVQEVSPFFAAMKELMTQQERRVPAPLHCEELVELAHGIEQAVRRWSDLNIPDAVGCLDLNPGNILVPQSRCVFLDWAEAYVGPPFLALDYLLGHCRQVKHDYRLETLIKERYLRPWKRAFPAEHLTNALDVARLFAPFAYAVATDVWRDPDQLRRPEIGKLMRSLTRRMHREFKNPGAKESI